MKKKLALLVTMAMVLGLTACGGSSSGGSGDAEPAVPETKNEADTEKGEGVMTYEEYMAAELETEVVVETYIQAKQEWLQDETTGQGKATFYTQDADGAYFLFEMPCTEEEYNQLPVGAKIKVTGYKSEWSGETEITEGKFEIEEGSYIADAVDVTDKLGTDDLINYQNQYVTLKGLTVEPAAEGSEDAYMYNWDGSGDEGDDLYFNVSLNGQTYSFTVESLLCGSDTDVYKQVKELKVGDVVDLNGYLYWYEGPNPHITVVTIQ